MIRCAYQDLLHVGGHEDPGGRDEGDVEPGLAEVLVSMQLELVDVEDDAREVAQEERGRDAGEDGEQATLVTVALVLEAVKITRTVQYGQGGWQLVPIDLAWSNGPATRYTCPTGGGGQQGEVDLPHGAEVSQPHVYRPPDPCPQ